MTTVTADPNFDIDVEADLLSRLLSAIATHSNLPDALMTFHADLPENEAIFRSSLVLTRMDEILPADVLLRLRQTNSHTDQSADQTGMATATQKSLVERFALLACLVASVVVASLSIIGGIATYHYLMGSHPPFQSWSTLNLVLRNILFSLCI